MSNKLTIETRGLKHMAIIIGQMHYLWPSMTYWYLD